MSEFLIRSLDASTIFLIAGLGELFGQRSGIINVGIEGVMLFGATLGFITAQSTGSYLLGFIVGIAVGGLLGFLHGVFSISLGGDQVVSGMGIWILGFGLTTYLGSPFTGPLGMERIPTILGLSPFFYVGIFLAVFIWFVLTRTSLGLRIRSVGENPSVAEVSGINVARTRYLCVTVGGMLMGFAGAIYSLDYNPVWSYNFLLGWGFIALALVFLLDVESPDFNGRLFVIWYLLAAFSQSAARFTWCFFQICVADGAFYHDPWRPCTYVN